MRRIARSELKPATPLTDDALLRQAARDTAPEPTIWMPRIYTAVTTHPQPCLACDGVIREGDQYRWRWIRGDWKAVHEFCIET